MIHVNLPSGAVAFVICAYKVTFATHASCINQTLKTYSIGYRSSELSSDDVIIPPPPQAFFREELRDYM